MNSKANFKVGDVVEITSCFPHIDISSMANCGYHIGHTYEIASVKYDDYRNYWCYTLACKDQLEYNYLYGLEENLQLALTPEKLLSTYSIT